MCVGKSLNVFSQHAAKHRARSFPCACHQVGGVRPPVLSCCRLTGLPPKYFPVPIALMDGIIGIFDLLAKVFPQLEVGLKGGGGHNWYVGSSVSSSSSSCGVLGVQ